ncbi:MAG: phage holin family protein [Candidatus Bathyarchaeota archaeon]|nr:phage holin family protein [Candidatus Bathyarchaeum sp.]
MLTDLLKKSLRRDDNMGVPHPKGHSKFCVNGKVFSEAVPGWVIAVAKKTKIQSWLRTMVDCLFCGAISLFLPPFPPLSLAFVGLPFDASSIVCHDGERTKWANGEKSR